MKRVDAFTITAAASTRAAKRRVAVIDSLTIASVWPVPNRRMWSRASSSVSTTAAAMSADRYSVPQSASTAATTSSL